MTTVADPPVADPPAIQPSLKVLVAAYGQLSALLMDDWGDTFYEVILPGAFDRALVAAGNIAALAYHQKDKILGSTDAGTLKLWTDNTGLWAEITPGDTSYAKDIMELVSRKEVNGASFCGVATYDVTQWRPTLAADGTPIREVVEVFPLVEVSVTWNPAYAMTSVEVQRELAKARTYSRVANKANSKSIWRHKLAAV